MEFLQVTLVPSGRNGRREDCSSVYACLAKYRPVRRFSVVSGMRRRRRSNQCGGRLAGVRIKRNGNFGKTIVARASSGGRSDCRGRCRRGMVRVFPIVVVYRRDNCRRQDLSPAMRWQVGVEVGLTARVLPTRGLLNMASGPRRGGAFRRASNGATGGRGVDVLHANTGPARRRLRCRIGRRRQFRKGNDRSFEGGKVHSDRTYQDNVVSRYCVFQVHARYVQGFGRAAHVEAVRRDSEGGRSRSASGSRPVKRPLTSEYFRLFRHCRLHETSISAVVPTLGYTVSSRRASSDSVHANVHYYAFAGFPTRLSMKAGRCLRPITSRVTMASP